MTNYATTVNPAVDPPALGPTSAYAVETYYLAYGTVLVPADSQIVPRPTASNYRLAFSADLPYIHPSVGQLWPRGQGNRI
jgi:hypothetical protein